MTLDENKVFKLIIFEKDFLIFVWSYNQFGSRYVYDDKWFILRLVQKERTDTFFPSENIVKKCSLTAEMLTDENNIGIWVTGKCVVPQLSFYLGYVAALLSRLAEIGIRTTFIVFTSIASILFEALEEKIEEMGKKSELDQEYSKQEMPEELDQLRRHYDLLCRLVEQINRSFGFVLLLITVHDFAISILDFNYILDHLKIGQGFLKDINNYLYTGYYWWLGKPKHFEWTDYFFDPLFEDDFIFLRSNPLKTCQFVHPILRFLLILVASHRVGSKVEKVFLE